MNTAREVSKTLYSDVRGHDLDEMNDDELRQFASILHHWHELATYRLENRPRAANRIATINNVVGA